MVNRLGKETSPYLQKHKDNPINWWSYCKEAFDTAKKEEKPLFISIGYSTCHWCHVMARESFTDDETANFMNVHFINIKIDREEYPGVDKAYQEMYQILNRRGGGWPLSVYANPDGSPFFIGTYFPKKPSFGMHSFMEINQRIVEAWKKERDLLDQQATNLIRSLRSLSQFMYNLEGDITESIYDTELVNLRKRFDPTNGGIGGAPKFPRGSTLRFLLQEGYVRNLPDIINYVSFTFHKMVKGGIYDQLGGGFARYSVDTKWLVPHFEKMLYDNAVLIQLESELYAITNDPYIEWIVKDTINWVVREMRSSVGGFYSALNADSKDENSIEREGAFYVWSKKELQKLLKDNYKIAELRYGITKKGNFHDPHHKEIKGMNILSQIKSMQEIASILNHEEDLVFQKLNVIRQIMFETRNKRIAPSKDTKIITSWNALMIKALYVTAELLNYPQAAKFAKGALEFVLENLVKDDRIIRNYHLINEGQESPEIDGILDDYSFLIAALIQAFEYTDNWNYIKTANNIQKILDIKFYDEKAGVYYVNPIEKDDLISKIIQISDDSMPSSLAVTVSNLFKLGKYLSRKEFEERGLRITKKFIGRINDYPGAMNELLISASNYLRYPVEIVIINDEQGTINNAHFSKYLPNRLIYRWNSINNSDGRPKWDVLEGRLDVQKPTAFICKGMRCSLPLTTLEGIQKELSQDLST